MRTSYSVLLWISVSLCLLSTNANARQSSTSVNTGYIRLLPDTGTSSPAGVAIFGLQNKGTLISEAGVPATTTIQSGRIFAEAGGPVNTGIALANPGSRDVAVSYYFTDSSGTDFNQGSLKLPANRQIAAFLNEPPFNLASSLAGTFTFTSSAPIAAVALRSLVNERSEVLITTVPVTVLDGGSLGTALLIPHFVSGDGWMTAVVLVNPGDTALSGSIRFFGQGSNNGSAQPIKVIVNSVTSSTFQYRVPPHGAFEMQTQPAISGTQIGSVRINPSSSSAVPSSLAIFTYRPGGVTVSAASVPALPASRALRMYIESSGVFGQVGSIQTGMSISNPSRSRVTVQMNVMNLDGTSTGLSTSVSVPGGGQIAQFAGELFPQLPSPFRGVLMITAPTPIVMAGLRGRYNQRGELLMTTTSPSDDTSALSLKETVVPHFVSGGGYSTQLILLSPGTSVTGSILMVSQDGLVLPSSQLQPSQ